MKKFYNATNMEEEKTVVPCSDDEVVKVTTTVVLGDETREFESEAVILLVINGEDIAPAAIGRLNIMTMVQGLEAYLSMLDAFITDSGMPSNMREMLYAQMAKLLLLKADEGGN